MIYKTDQSGYMYQGWPRTLGSDVSKLDQAMSITLAPDNTYTISGFATNAADQKAILVANYFADGIYNWSKSYGGTSEDISSDILTYSNGFILTGSSISYGVNERDMILMNLQTNGSSCLQTGTFNPVGGAPITFGTRVNTQLYNYFTHETVTVNPTVTNAGSIINTKCGN